MDSEETIYDNDFGNIPVIRVNGNVCNYCIVDSKASKRYNDFKLLCKDLDICIECLDDIEELNNLKDFYQLSVRLKPKLLITLIVTYAKCFTRTNNRATLNWEKDVLKFANGEDVSKRLDLMHKHIIDVRNTYVAHHQSKKYEKSFLICYLNPDINNKSLVKSISRIVYMTDIDKYLDEVRILFNFVYCYCKNKIDKLETKLDQELNIKDLYLKAKSVNEQMIIKV